MNDRLKVQIQRVVEGPWELQMASFEFQVDGSNAK
jgi:hypothetical protein